MERRDFLKHTAAIASVAATGVTNALVTEPNASRHFVGAVLVDERYSDSRQFAAAYTVRGAALVSLTEDIGRLWYGRLRELCNQPDARIAGLTLHTDLFVSQQFARECGKSLIQFGEHDCRGRSTLAHTTALSIPDNAQWATHAANCMMDMHGNGNLEQHKTLTCNTPRAADHPGSLYSWMIA